MQRGSLALTVMLIFHASVCLAQTESAKPISPAARAEIAGALGFSPTSRRMEEIVSAYNRSLKPQPPALRSQPPPPPAVIRYIRGKEGIQFPTAGAPLESRVDSKKIAPFVSKAQQDIRTEFARQTTPRELPKCGASKTEVTRFKKRDRKKKSEVAFDLLVIPAAQVPLESAEIFGRQVLIIEYHDDEVHGGSLAALGVGVDCLPYRMRVTSGGTYHHRGVDALRNFDSDPDGEGDLDPRGEAIWSGMK